MKKISILALFSLILILSVSIASAEEINDIDDISSVSEASELEINEDNDELSSGNTIYISPDGTGDGSSDKTPTDWNSAIAKATSGDTIQFANGTYKNIKGDILFDLNMKGSGDSKLDAAGNGGFLTIGSTKYSTSIKVTLTDLTFMNAYTGEKEGSPDGPKTGFDGEGAIVNGGILTVKNCNFNNNTGIGTKGGAIHNGGTCYIYDSTFFSNGGKKGGAIYCDKQSSLYIYNSLIRKCVSKEGSAVHAKSAYVEVQNCTVRDSSAKNGLFYIKESTIKLNNSTFYNCRAVDAAAVINIDKQSTVEIDRCVFDKLSATGSKLWFHQENGTGNGGAIVVEKEGNTVVIKNSVFTNCSAKGEGGAIYIQSNTPVTIENCTFKSNKAGEGGNHIYSYGSPASFTITNSRFEVESVIETSDVKSGEAELINFTVDDGTNAILNPTYSVYVNKQEYSSSDCKRGLKFKDGNYTAELRAKDSNGNVYTFTMPKSLFVVGVDIEAEFSYSFNNNTSMNVAVTDQFGRQIAGKKVNVTIDGEKYSAITDAQGIAQISPALKAGSHTISVEVEGAKASSSNPATIDVPQDLIPHVVKTSIIGENLTRAQNSDYDYKAQFFDANSNPLKNKTVQFILNGNEYDAVTDEKGFAVFKMGLLPGVYDITAHNPATDEDLTCSLNILSRFGENKDIKMDYTYSATYKFRVFDDDGNPLGAGEAVIVKIDGKDAKTILTDANGYIVLKIKNNKLLPKTHSITAEYKGVTVSNKLVVKQILKAKNKKFKRYKVKKYSVTLKTSLGKAIKGKKITFKIKGKTYKAKTNRKGVATIKIKALTKVGKYKITVKYLKTSVKKTITVKR